MAPRQGRQPRHQPGSAVPRSSTKPAKPSKSKATKSKAATSSAPMDVYSYSTNMKRARGDVDPEARAAFKGGKGKARQDSEDEDLSEDDLVVGADGFVEFTGVKPKGLKMGMSDDEEGGVGGFGDDDEDINSDEAEEDDEDLPAKQPKAFKKSSKPIEVDLDEDEVDYDDEDGEGFMDLTELLDNGEYASDSDDDDEADSASGADSDSGSEDDDEDEDIESDESIDSEYEGALTKLNSFVDTLESKKRKQGDSDDDASGQPAGGQKKKRVVLKERTEAYDEGSFVAVGAQEGVNAAKVQLDDLLASFANSKNPKLAALRKSLKPLANATASSAGPAASTSHLKGAGPIAAPLPARLQDKLDREAAYEKTREETDKWNETVRRMKGASGLGVEGARHERLQLPLMGGGGDAARDANAAEWSAKFKPQNEMESAIQALVAAGGMGAKDLQKAEQAALAALDPADVAARQAALRQQRDLMFRAERKAKRVAKIKSKAFRRIHRRGKGKGEEGLSLEDLEELDRLDGGDRVAEEQARMETQRARERATLKHGAKNGRWSKQSGGLEGLDEERNASIRDMVTRGEVLRRKIAGNDGEEEDEFASSASDGDRSDEDADLDSIRNRAFDELASLDAKEAAANANGPKLKGVLNMKFMQDALKREQAQVQADADELRRKLSAMDQAGEGSDSEGDEPLGSSEQVQGNLGRMVFGPAAGVQRALDPAAAAAASAPAPKAQLTTKLSGPFAVAAAASTRPARASPLAAGAAASGAEANPWLAVDAEAAAAAGKVSRKMNKATGKGGKDADRSAAKADRALARQGDARAAEQDDAQVEIDPTVVLAKAKAPRQPQLQAGASAAAGRNVSVSRPTTREEVDSSDEEGDEVEHAAQRGKGPAAFAQRELVAKAFAGDNVVADFEAEKRREIERDAPREEDNTLPGWGAWSGKGVKKPKKPAKKFITKIAGIAPEARKDASFSNVIISEKKDKKAAKYLLKDLPFPYTSAAQMEHKLRTPLGPEWSTSTILRDQTMPSVLIKPGVTIRPVDRKV